MRAVTELLDRWTEKWRPAEGNIALPLSILQNRPDRRDRDIQALYDGILFTRAAVRVDA